jgi:hypothetical protein
VPTAVKFQDETCCHIAGTVDAASKATAKTVPTQRKEGFFTK